MDDLFNENFGAPFAVEIAPPRTGVAPKIRIGKRWINLLLVLTVGFLVLVLGVAIEMARPKRFELSAF